MYQLITFQTATLRLTNSISRSPLRRVFFLIPVALALFAFAPAAQAVSPAPDGGYPGNNTAEGTNALFSLTTGGQNTALGGFSLFSDAIGHGNMAIGVQALQADTTGAVNTAVAQGALFHTTGNSNIALGSDAGFNIMTGNNNIDIYDPGVAADANTIRVGTQGTQTATFI